MVLVLCYDVVDDTRRGRLFKRLKGFLRPVQKSVFEGHLPDRRWGELTRMVGDTIDPVVDSVRIYQLCRGCAGITALIGCSPVVGDHADPILI
ncbi:MAG: CRISPR-associated endonuclease Cas2 [Myxococcota bacterium]